MILVGAFYIKPENWTPFAPYGMSGVSFFGHPLMGQVNAGGQPVGMLAGAAIIFFAYIGFDSVSTHAEEAKNPKRDVPIGIIASLLICTVLYIAVVAVLTGMVRYDQSERRRRRFRRLQAERACGWAEFIIAAAGVAGITSVLLVLMLSAPACDARNGARRDGSSTASLRTSTRSSARPGSSTILVGVFVASLTGFLPIDALLHLTNIGTLFAFVVVCAAVLIMRRTEP